MELAERYTDQLTQDDLRELTEMETAPCLSIYLPTQRRGREVEQNPIRLKNLMQEAEERLLARDLRRPDVEELLTPIRKRVEEHEFWQHQSDGLAIFRSDRLYREFRLPASFEERAVVGERPYIKPLIPLLAANGRFYLLALSQDQVRLFEATRLQVGEVALPETPQSLAEAMRFDEFETQLQYHTGTGVKDGGQRAALFHGHSDAGNEAVVKENLKRFLRMVDTGVGDAIEQPQTPLVLAGVEYMQGLYREVAHYPTIVAEGLDGNPDDASARELHERAWPLVEERFLQEQEEAADRFLSLAGQGDARVSADVREIAPAAYFERVDTLFAAKDAESWGEFDAASASVSVHDERQTGDVDLFDFAVAHTLRNGGRVFVLEAEDVPGDGALAALYRYAVE